MEIKVVRDKIGIKELETLASEEFGDIVKAVVDAFCFCGETFAMQMNCG